MAVVEDAFAFANATAPGPLTMVHATETDPGGFGTPSSVTVPVSGAPAGSVIVWFTPASTWGGWLYVKRSAAVVALVCPPTVTVTSTVPRPAGAVAVQTVALAHVELVAEAAPNFTLVPLGAPNPVPAIVTRVPPVSGH